MNIQNFYVGVGKSLFSFVLVDYLLNRNADILLVDTDTDNPDVFKAHKELGLPNLLCRLNSLDDADGWADLLDTVQNYPDPAVVINAAARTKTSTASYDDIMKEALREMQQKIANASKNIMDGMAAAAEKETTAAQTRLTDSVVREAQNLASKIQYDTLVPMGLFALICLLAYGSLMLWAGFRIDTGRDMPLATILHMPSGWLICGLCLTVELFYGVMTAREFAEGNRR